jgi:hypothetical protein
MSKCVVCTSLNAEIEHNLRSKALDRKNADGSITKGYHHPTASTLKALKRRRAFYSPRTSPHKFCAHHASAGTPDFKGGTGRATWIGAK